MLVDDGIVGICLEKMWDFIIGEDRLREDFKDFLIGFWIVGNRIWSDGNSAGSREEGGLWVLVRFLM